MSEQRAQRDGDAWAKPVAHLEITRLSDFMTIEAGAPAPEGSTT